MCDQDKPLTTESAWQAVCGTGPCGVTLGSRRRRLWELDDHAYCPMVGVCLPVPSLRRIAEKTLHGWRNLSDYDLHCTIVSAAKMRSVVSELAHKELDKRFAVAVRMATKLKSTEALAVYWQEQVRGEDLAGALWATLTHARCTPELERDVLGQVHMIQHQVGMAVRVDLAAHEALQQANTTLQAQHAALTERLTRQSHEQALRQESMAAEIMQLRADLIARDTALSGAHTDLDALRASVPDFKSREALSRQCQALDTRLAALEQSLRLAREDAELERRRAAALTEECRRLAHRQTAAAAPPITEEVPDLRAQAVLCVGGRAASIPIYRQLVERSGGRFMHHDGGEEHNPNLLDSNLSAADLVICQTGCVSHDAYWRVKDHCKRTGKRCVFTDSPSMTGLKRALDGLTSAPSGDHPGMAAHGEIAHQD